MCGNNQHISAPVEVVGSIRRTGTDGAYTRVRFAGLFFSAAKFGCPILAISVGLVGRLACVIAELSGHEAKNS